VLLVSIFVPYASAYFWKRANNAGAISSFFGGLGVWIAMYFVHLPATIASNTNSVPGYEGTVYMEWARWDALYISSVWGLAASILCMIVVSLATQKRSEPRALRDIDGNLLPLVDWRGIFRRRERERPAGPIGVR
jgi:SSS family solute:Na+ symporter